MTLIYKVPFQVLFLYQFCSTFVTYSCLLEIKWISDWSLQQVLSRKVESGMYCTRLSMSSKWSVLSRALMLRLLFLMMPYLFVVLSKVIPLQARLIYIMHIMCTVIRYVCHAIYIMIINEDCKMLLCYWGYLLFYLKLFLAIFFCLYFL